MKNVLIVTAHPSKKNLTNGIAEVYKNEKEAQGNTVEIIALYKDTQLPFYTFEDAHSIEVSSDAKHYQDKVSSADEIVFIYPFWWGTMPAILKNWIDTVFTMGYAATYNEKGRPVGLLQGRSVRIISTSGAPTFFYCINGIRRANKKIWKQTIIEFCAMKFDGYHLFGGVDTSGKNVNKIFESVKKLANK